MIYSSDKSGRYCETSSPRSSRLRVKVALRGSPPSAADRAGLAPGSASSGARYSAHLHCGRTTATVGKQASRGFSHDQHEGHWRSRLAAALLLMCVCPAEVLGLVLTKMSLGVLACVRTSDCIERSRSCPCLDERRGSSRLGSFLSYSFCTCHEIKRRYPPRSPPPNNTVARRRSFPPRRTEGDEPKVGLKAGSPKNPDAILLASSPVFWFQSPLGPMAITQCEKSTP